MLRSICVATPGSEEPEDGERLRGLIFDPSRDDQGRAGSS
jgi:hypothetical protein